MRVLALDTTTRAGSVALVSDGVADERRGDPSRSHAERLPADLLELLDAHGLRVRDVDVFAVACGPGSFTGLRVGIASMQGLAFTMHRPIVPVSALDALGHLASLDQPARALVAACMDAHRGEIFSALYRVADAPPFATARLEELEGPAVGDPAATADRWRASGFPAPDVFAGDGAERYGPVLAGSMPRVVGGAVLAGVIGRIAAGRAREGLAVDPGAVRPLYVRRPDAEIDRERRRT